jgi:hypothetical protein
MQIWSGTQQERDYLNVPSVHWGDVKMNLKRIRVVRYVLKYPGKGTTVGYCEHGNKPFS